MGSDPVSSAVYARRRAHMVADQLVRRGIDDPAVLQAMERVPRHRFLPQAHRDRAYLDTPVDIEGGQTISQPYAVALMAQLAHVHPGDRVLDVGTGSGYQAAVLAELGADVHSVEIRPQLAQTASARLADLGYDRVQVAVGDGAAGWPEGGRFRAILVAAAPRRVPEALLDQLEEGGRLIVPVGDEAEQELLVLQRTAEGIRRQRITSVLFVPLVGPEAVQAADGT